MDYLKRPQYHYKPKKGFMNDPNGLVYFNGYYHLFYQHCPDLEEPWKQPVHWGHAITKDFINWEELPIALYPDQPYEDIGCWSGTATVKDGILYLIYSSVYTANRIQTVSVAYSEDGVNFKKYEGNPVINTYPEDGGPNFRDPAVRLIDGRYYLVMASGHDETQKARLLLYESENLFDWTYTGILCEWADSKFAECPSFMQAEDGNFLLTASVVPVEGIHYFTVMYGEFKDKKFTVKYSSEVDKGPDQYAGQVFKDHLGRNILMAWIPGWEYVKYAEKDVGCISLPRELKLVDGKIYGYPVQEVQHLLKEEDPAVKMTDTGFIVERTNREPFVYEGKINDIKMLRDEYVLEIFLNKGLEVYTVLL